MKLTTTDTNHLSTILSTSAICGIESIIIEDGIIRGINEARSCVIISNNKVPSFPQKLGLSRLNSLRQRMEMFSSDVDIVAKETDRGEISSLEISSGRSKVQYRCTSTALIKAPKSVRDESLHTIKFSKDELKLVLNAVKIMSAKTVQIIIKKDNLVSVRIADSTNDAFETVLESSAITNNETDSVVHNYHADIFNSVLRTHTDGVSIIIGISGTITTCINEHNVVILPKVGEDEED